MTEQSDIATTYKQMLSSFYKLYPDKEGKYDDLTEQDIIVLIDKFGDSLRKHNEYFNLFAKKQGKLFKGLSVTLIPKLKMEVVLNLGDLPSEEKQLLVNEMWNSIYLLYLLYESKQAEPNKVNMAKIALLLDKDTKQDNVNNDESANKNNLNFLGKDINLDNLEEMMNKIGINKEQMNDLKNNIDQDKIKELLGQFNAKPTEKSDKFVKDVLSDIKSKFKLNVSSENGKIDSKQFVEQLMNVGNTLGDSYGEKIKSGELSISDIIGAVSSVASGSNVDSMDDIVKSLDLDKLDLNEILNELKSRFNDKIPPELLATLGGLSNGDLKNLDIGSLVGKMMSNGNQEDKVVDLTEEQKKELAKYYEDLTL